MKDVDIFSTKVQKALFDGFEARTKAMIEDPNDFIGAFNIGAIAFYDSLTSDD